MYIKDTGPYKYGKFEINLEAIDSRTSINQNEVVFPFNGDLPLPYKAATISFDVSHETRIVTITAERDGKPPKTYFVAADVEEVEAVLWSFFYEDAGELAITRTDNGLSPFNRGICLARYEAWANLQREPLRIIGILQQLSPEQRKEIWPDVIGMKESDEEREDDDE